VLYSAPAFQPQEQQRALAVRPRLLLGNEGLWTDPADWMFIQSHPKQTVLIDRGIIIRSDLGEMLICLNTES
jgi:hypothetical protein